jgi:hypothetical protein
VPSGEASLFDVRALFFVRVEADFGTYGSLVFMFDFLSNTDGWLSSADPEETVYERRSAI